MAKKAKLKSKKSKGPSKPVVKAKQAPKAVAKAKVKHRKSVGPAKSKPKSIAKSKSKAPAKKGSSTKITAKAIAKKPLKILNKQIDYSKLMTPLDDRVLVQVQAGERMTPGGLFIPDTVENAEGNLKGVVLSVGRGRQDKKGRLHKMDLSVGDKVIFQSFSGSKIKMFDTDLVILREVEVLGVIA